MLTHIVLQIEARIIAHAYTLSIRAHACRTIRKCYTNSPIIIPLKSVVACTYSLVVSVRIGRALGLCILPHTGSVLRIPFEINLAHASGDWVV